MAKAKQTHARGRWEGIRRANLFWVSPDRLKIIGVDTEDGIDHPDYPKDPSRYRRLDPVMVESMRAHGVKMPVIARLDQKRGYYVVREGRRRVLHARAAGVEVPFVVEGTADAMAALETKVLGNSFRVEDSLLSKAGMADELRRGGRDVGQVAVLFGVKPNTIRTWLTLLNAAPEVQAAVKEGVVSESAAATLAALPVEKQTAALEAALAVAGGAQGGGRVTHQTARAEANKAVGRGDEDGGNVGIRSRKQMRALRDYCASGFEAKGAKASTYLQGVADALTLVLGDKTIHRNDYDVNVRALLRESTGGDK